MGLFSGKTKIYVSAAALHLVDASATPVKDAVLTALLKNESLSGTIMKALLNGMGNKVRLAHRYAKDHYPLGLPQGETLSYDPVNNEELIPYVLAETGYPYGILVTEHLYTQFTPAIAIYEYLANVRKYDDETNAIAVWPQDLEFTPIPHHDVNSLPRKVEIQHVTLNPDGLHADVIYDLYVYRTVVKRTYEPDGWESTEFVEEWVKDANSHTETVPIPESFQGVGWNGDCLVASYRRQDSEGQLLEPEYLWVYHLADDLYPELHPGSTELPDEFMPVIPLRYNNVDLTDASVQNEPPDPENLYSHSKKMLKKLNVDFGTLGSKLNENPGIADIDHAYVMWGVDTQSDFAPSLFYLTEFFDNLHMLQEASELEFLNALADPEVDDEPRSNYVTNRLGNSYSGNDPSNAFREYGLVLNLRHDYITSEIVVGTIGTGKVGYAEKSIEPYTVTINWTHYGESGEPLTSSREETRWRLVLRAQVLPDQVKTVKVHNLVMFNYIYGSKYHMTTLDEVLNDPDEHNLIVPIQYNLASKFTLPQRNVLYADAMMVVVNSVVKVRTKWYQSGFFKAILIVVAVIIAAYTGQWWLVKAAAVYGAAGIVGLMLFIGASLLISITINMAVDWIVTTYGEKIGIIGTIVLMVVALVVSKGFGLAGNPSQFMMATAQYMMQGATALISSTNEFLVEKGEDLRDEFAAFTEKLDGLWEELEEVQDLLKNKSDIDPLLFARPSRFKIVPNESPSAFYTRCLGLPDNTMFTIHDEIPNFIDNHLKIRKDISPEMYAMNTYS